MAKKSTQQIQPTTVQEVTSVDTKTVIAATTEKMQSVIVAAGIDPVTTVGMQEVKIIRAVFDKHLADLESLLPECGSVKDDDHVTAKKLALRVMRIRTAADKDRLDLNKESRARIAAVDGANKVLLHVLTPVEKHLNKIVDDHAAAAQKVIEDQGRLRAAQVAQYVKNVDGYDFVNMSEEVFQRVLVRVRDEKEAADKLGVRLKAERERAEAEANASALLAKEQAEIAQRERAAAEAEARKLREELEAAKRAAEAAKRAEEDAKRAEEQKALAEKARIQRIQDQLKELSDLTAHNVSASSGPVLDSIAGRLDEFAAMAWCEMDMEAEGRIDIARAWLKSARAQAESLHAEEAKRLAAETEARRLAVAGDVEKLQAFFIVLDRLSEDCAAKKLTLSSDSAKNILARFRCHIGLCQNEIADFIKSN